MIVYAETVEEKPIDRYYNRNSHSRVTHYELLGNGISYCLRRGYHMQVVILNDEN